MKTKVKNKHQNINIAIDIENSIFSKNKIKSVNDKPQSREQQMPQPIIQQIPQPMYNSRLPDEFNMYNAIMASWKLYELPVNREPYIPAAFQTPQQAAPRSVMQTPQQSAAQATPIQQPAAQATPIQQPVSQSTPIQFMSQQSGLTGPLQTAARPLSLPRQIPLTVQGSAQPAVVPISIQNPQQSVPRNLSPPRNLSIAGYPSSPAAAGSTDINQSMLHPLQSSQQISQPLFQPIQAIDHNSIPLVDLQLQDDDPINGFRRPLDDAEEQKFINHLSDDQRRRREIHIIDYQAGKKNLQLATIKQYRLEKYVPNIAAKFN